MRTILVLSLLLAAAVPAVASASPEEIYEDCQDGRLDRGYEGSVLREAIREIPKDLDEYTNCREIIRAAQRGVRGPGGAGPVADTGGGGAPAGATTYGPQPLGGGGLPVGADKRQVDPLGFATPDEVHEILRAREGRTSAPAAREAERDGSLVPASAGQAPLAESRAGLPGALVVLLVMTGAGLAAMLGVRVRSLVLRRSS